MTAGGATAKTSVIAVANRLKFSMTPAGDKLNAGVDWTASCGGNPVTGSVSNGACGTFTPAHTADGAATLYTAPSVIPINTTVSITGTMTANASQSSTVALTVIPSPIAVLLQGNIGSPVPASLNTNATASLNDTVTNDPLGAGVIYTATCASAACGSFNPTQAGGSQGGTTYTAPSAVPQGGTVTITATSLTDTSAVGTATVAITAPAAQTGLAISIAPSTVYAQTVGPAHRANLTAIVTNDSATAGADWRVTCAAANCGGITAHTASGVAAVYTAPSTVPNGGTVTITAAATSNPAVTASATASVVTATPIVVTQTAPPPATLTAGAGATLVASVKSDPNNLGVDWSASCGGSTGCGTFSLTPAHTASGGQIVYTAPAAVPADGGVVTITATSTASSATTPANPAVAVTTIVAQPPSVAITQQPPATLTATTQAPVSATVANDVAPGGVTWSTQCGSTVPGGCGFVSPAQTASGATATYTAPPFSNAGTPVTIVATSTADASASTSSNAVTINPNTTLAVNFVPSLPAQVQPSGTVNLTAAVANDATNAGVDWQVCADGCGFFTVQPEIAANPALGILPVAAVTATSVSGWSNGLPISYTAPPQAPSSGSVTVVALAHASNATANSGVIAINNILTGPALNGVVQAGAQPVAAAAVSLLAAGTSGYASGAAQVGSATTDKNGRFVLPAGYTCPSPSSQMYLLASGGSVGGNAANPNLELMTALGNCSNLGSTAVTVNEVTTVASVWPTAQFAANDALNGNNSYLYLGTSGSNTAGLANAFSTVNNLVDITTGIARYTTPPGNAAVPYAEINTLANALNACTATAGGVEGDGSACGTLFTATDVLPAGTQIPNVIAPSDTLQAAYNIAQHPVTTYGYQLLPSSIQALSTTGSPFQPALTAAPNDWSLSLNYTGGGGLSTTSNAGSFAIDGTGNLWITDSNAGSAIEWNAAGAAISPATGYPAGGTSTTGLPIAIDISGNAWISGAGQLNELTALGTPAPGSPFKGVSAGGSDVAFDQQGNLWIAAGSLYEFNSLAAPISLDAGIASQGVTGINAVGIDSSNNVWVGYSATAGYLAELTNPGGSVIANTDPSQTAAAGPIFPGVAADRSGGIWLIRNTGECHVPAYPGVGLLFDTGNVCTAEDNAGGSPPFFNPGGLALDGAGTVWIASQGGPVVPPSILPIAPSLTGNSTELASPSLAAGPVRVAVDGSGNVWVLLAGNAGVTEYVGAAVPVVTPTALAIKNNKLAAKP